MFDKEPPLWLIIIVSITCLIAFGWLIGINVQVNDIWRNPNISVFISAFIALFVFFGTQIATNTRVKKERYINKVEELFLSISSIKRNVNLLNSIIFDFKSSFRPSLLHLPPSPKIQPTQIESIRHEILISSTHVELIINMYFSQSHSLDLTMKDIFDKQVEDVTNAITFAINNLETHGTPSYGACRQLRYSKYKEHLDCLYREIKQQYIK